MKSEPYDREQARILGEIVSYVFEANVFENRRLRPNVNARMVFSKILLDKGVTFTEVGRLLNKTHATILHYNNKLSFFLKHDYTLRQKYFRCAHDYNLQSVNTLSKTQLLNELYNVKQELDDIKDKYSVIENNKKESSRSDERLGSLYKIIKDRTKVGKEQEMETRINRLYNTVA